MRYLHATMTSCRYNYLRAVEKAGVYEPRHGPTACHCLRLGWVENVAEYSDGTVGPYLNVEARGGITVTRWLGVRLTSEGREILQCAKAARR